MKIYGLWIDGMRLRIPSMRVYYIQIPNYRTQVNDVPICHEVHYENEKGEEIPLAVEYYTEDDKHADKLKYGIIEFYKAYHGDNFDPDTFRVEKAQIYNMATGEYVEKEVRIWRRFGNRTFSFILDDHLLHVCCKDEGYDDEYVLNNIVIMDLLEEYNKIK